jgi:hypothetical protein
LPNSREEPLRCCRSRVAESIQQKKSAASEKTGLLSSPTTNRRGVADTSTCRKPENRAADTRDAEVRKEAFCMGTPSPYPWDLSLSGNNGSLGCRPLFHPACRWSAPNGTPCLRGADGVNTRPAIAAAESALRSRRRGALSSAQLQSVLLNDMRTSRNVHGTTSV